MSLPRVEVVSLGGTIAMTGTASSGVLPALTGADLVAAVPQLAEIARVSGSSFRLIPGAHLALDDIVALADHVRRLLVDGADGVVITQGTDTIEEVAFALDLLFAGEAPVVVTGAMRNPTLPGADGPANLLAAVRVASAQVARGLGVLVVFNDEIHAARYVQKTHTMSPSAFSSRLVGPLGWVAEGTPRIATRLLKRHHVSVSLDMPDRPVALLTLSLGDDGRLLGTIEKLGFAGLVVEALGGGHVPATVAEQLERLAAAMPAVFASRTGNGEVLRQTYGFAGSEIDLKRRGLVGAGPLDGPKARVLLSLLLRTGATREEINRRFETWLE